MITDINSEDQLVQQTFADHLRDRLGWESVYAHNAETFGAQGTLGRASERDVVLVRDLRVAHGAPAGRIWRPRNLRLGVTRWAREASEQPIRSARRTDVMKGQAFLLVSVIAALSVASTAMAQEPMQWSFDDVPVGQLPEGWSVEGTNQRGPVASWVVRTREGAPSRPNVFALTDPKDGASATFNLSWTDRVRFADGVVEVKVHANSGREDQGGGPIWRVQDKDNYYIVRWNPLENNFRLYLVKDGDRKMLKSANVEADAAAWHTVRIEHTGDDILCAFDDEVLLRARDQTFQTPGGVGLWTKADAATAFDDLIVTPRAASARPDLPEGSAVRAYLTNFGGDGVSVVEPYTGEFVGHIKTGRKPHGVVIAPDGRAVYVSNEGDGTVSVVDPATNAVTASIEVGESPNQLEVSADGRHLFVTLHGPGALAVVDVEARRVARVVPIGRTPHIALRSPDGSRIYATSEGEMKVVAIDARTFDVVAEIPLLAFPRVLAVTPDGRRLYQTIRWLNGALVIDLAQGKVVDRVALGEPHFATEGKDAHGLAVAPDGRELWLTTQTTNTVTVIDTGTHEVLARFAVGRDPNWVGFTPDGRLAVVSNTGSGDASVVHVRERRVVATVSVGSSPKRLAVGIVRVRD